MSDTMTVPPGRTTRANSATTGPTSGTWESASEHTTTSTDASSTGRARRSPTRKSPPGTLASARASIVRLASTPMTSKPRSARWRLCRPVPHAASSASPAGTEASRSRTTPSSTSTAGLGPSYTGAQASYPDARSCSTTGITRLLGNSSSPFTTSYTSSSRSRTSEGLVMQCRRAAMPATAVKYCAATISSRRSAMAAVSHPPSTPRERIARLEQALEAGDHLRPAAGLGLAAAHGVQHLAVRRDGLVHDRELHRRTHRLDVECHLGEWLLPQVSQLRVIPPEDPGVLGLVVVPCVGQPPVRDRFEHDRVLLRRLLAPLHGRAGLPVRPERDAPVAEHDVGVGERGPERLGCGPDVCRVHERVGHGCCLQGGLERGQRLRVLPVVVVDPAVGDVVDRGCVQVVQLPPALADRGDQLGPLEHREVLGHRLPHHGEAGAQLGEGLAVPGVQAVEQLTARRVGQRLEHSIRVGRRRRGYATRWSGWASSMMWSTRSCSRNAFSALRTKVNPSVDART